MNLFGEVVDDLWLEVAKAIGAILLAVAVYWLGRFRDGLTKTLNVRAAINKNMLIRDILADVRGAYEADRVRLYQFHNGEYFSSGNSIQKMSMTHCVVRDGIAMPPAMSAHQNIPVSHVASLIAKVLEAKALYVERQDMSDDFYLRPLMVIASDEASVFTPVRGRRGEIHGMLMVSWTHIPECPSCQDVEKALEFAERVAAELIVTGDR